MNEREDKYIADQIALETEWKRPQQYVLISPPGCGTNEPRKFSILHPPLFI